MSRTARPRHFGSRTLLFGLLVGACGPEPLGTLRDAQSADMTNAFDAGTADVACNCGIVATAAPPQACTFPIPCPEGDFFRLRLITSTGNIPQDSTDANGWNYTDASRMIVRLYGQPCTDIMSGVITQVLISYGC